MSAVHADDAPRGAGFIGRLIGAAALIEQGGDLESGLRELTASTARLLEVDRCSIMLLGEDDQDADGPSLRVYAHFGDLPSEAHRQATRISEGISGHVAATGEALLIPDISHSPFAAVARRSADHSLIVAPIEIGDRVIGVINVSGARGGRAFDARDLELVEVFARVVGKSIHIAQLQNVLHSRFLQLALALERRTRDGSGGPISPDPAQLAKIVAKTIHRELGAGGFSTFQILSVASELIGLLNDGLGYPPGA